MLHPLALVGAAAHRRVQAETLHVGTQRLGERGVSGHGALHREQLLPGTRAEGDAVCTCGRLQWPQRSGVIRLSIAVCQVGRLLLFDEHAAAGQQLHQPADDLVKQRLQPFIGGRGYFDKDRLTVSAPVDAVEHQAVQVDVQVGGRSEALDQRDRAAVGLGGLEPGLIEQEAREQRGARPAAPASPAWVARPATGAAESAATVPLQFA